MSTRVRLPKDGSAGLPTPGVDGILQVQKLSTSNDRLTMTTDGRGHEDVNSSQPREEALSRL